MTSPPVPFSQSLRRRAAAAPASWRARAGERAARPPPTRFELGYVFAEKRWRERLARQRDSPSCEGECGTHTVFHDSSAAHLYKLLSSSLVARTGLRMTRIRRSSSSIRDHLLTWKDSTSILPVRVVRDQRLLLQPIFDDRALVLPPGAHSTLDRVLETIVLLFAKSGTSLRVDFLGGEYSFKVNNATSTKISTEGSEYKDSRKNDEVKLFSRRAASSTACDAAAHLQWYFFTCEREEPSAVTGFLPS